MTTTRENIGYIVAVTKMVSKLTKIREKRDNNALADLLEKSEFFQRLANDLTERQELIKSASEHMKYKFYPKGSIIHGYDEPVCSVRAIMKGKAYMYTPRKQDVTMKKEYYDLKKSQVIREYNQHIEDQQLQEKFTQWLNKKEAGTRALRKRMNLLAARSDRNSVGNIELVDFSSVVNNILEDKSTVLPAHLRDYDITAKEKLLLLAHFGMMGKYIQDGVFTLEVTREMLPGDSYGEISLLKASTLEGVIVAAEDVHLISFARDDYRSLFIKDIPNLQNKIEFLTKMFTDISKASVIKIAYYLEEKVLMSRETLYKEGEEANAIYFVKKGEIQLSVQKTKSSKNLLKIDSTKSKSLERFSTKHQRIIVGSLQPGTMFGEEDVIQRNPRKYTAMATQPHTFVYVLKREVFTEIFEKHTPHIAAVFQDWMKVKSIWRNQRIGTEQEWMNNQEPEIANPYAMEIKSPTATHDVQQKFYTPKRERENFVAHTEHGDGPEFQERVTFRVLPSNKAMTPRDNSQSNNSEYQLFDRVQLDKISLSNRKQIKRIPIRPGKETPSRKEAQSARQSGSISTIPSLGDLPLSKPAENRPVKVRTLNNELVSAETRFPRKIKTLLNVDRDNCETAVLSRPVTNTLKSTRVRSYTNLQDGASPYMMTTTTLTTLSGMNTTNVVTQKRSGAENTKLSRESAKILHRLILKQPDLSEVNQTESQAATEEQFVNFHRREQRLLSDSNRVSVKRVESRENSLSRLPKSEYSLNIIHDERLRLKTGMGNMRNMIGKRTNTVTVKNVEFGLL